MATGRVHGVQRVLAKLDSSLKAGNYYEAHQMYRTLYFRYLAQKKYTDLLDLLFDGAIVLLQHNQQASGADLAILLVAVLSKSGAVVSDEYVLEKLPKLFSLIKPDVPEREVFLMNALQWSCSGSQEHRTGHPELHKNIAQIFWKERNFAMARHHFLYSTDGFGCASLLVEIHKMRGYAAEVDLFIAQAVLQYLCLQNMSTAQAAFHCYTSQHPNIKRGPPYILPLLNFIWFLLKAVESGKLNTFKVLCEQYQPSIKRDPSYPDYLNKIGHIFFGIPLPRAQPQGLFGNILQSFFSGLDEESDTESEQGPQPSTSSRQHQRHAQQSSQMETEELD